MTSSKKKSSTSTKKTISLRDYDPENEDFGGVADVKRLVSQSKKGASLKYGHLDDLKTNSVAFDEGFGGEKYAGRAISVEEFNKNNNAHSDSSVDEEDFEETSDYSQDDSEEFAIETEDSGYDFDNDDSQDDTTKDHDSESESESESETEIEVNNSTKSSSLSAKMRELEMKEDNQDNFKLVSNNTPADALEKSLHVRNQHVKFDDYVNIRFSLQPLLNSTNRFPDRHILSQAKRKNTQLAAALDDTVQELDSLMNDLLDLSILELEQDGITIPEPECDTATAQTTPLQGMWNRMSQIDAAIEPFARETLKKWHNKMTLSSDLKAKKSLRMLNQDPYQQVQIALQDEERLLARTRVRRDTSNKRFGSKDLVQDSPTPNDNDIFDDNDFYQVLLKDWTASHGALSSATASAMSAILVQPKKKHRDGVDPRASKGRKIRYDVHPKLVNYMVPQIERASWNDNKIDEFFASLLGQSISN